MSASAAAIRHPGFPAPVRDAQRVFRTALDALARPTRRHAFDARVTPPAPLGPEAGAVVLALCDEQTPIWLDDALRRSGEVEAWIRFHTGARIADAAGDALFCVASCPSAMPALDELAAGSDEEPHLSATVIVDATGVKPTGSFVATGPGIDGSAEWDGAGLPGGFLPAWRANLARFPRGVDLILAERGALRGLPRTTALAEGRGA
ncbi:phosphonate C-P lyase system protein PhnH [Microbacterium karelineae]|uniref:phosphonate C-P lyase system protein PhnH n=1 Tax=Microbacterium karelineae TaxID=2654283 RepID=UPI0012EA5AC9|nr:phosphonate C-P lyase system protein PhnH [Microbacterium karelineae]